MAHILHLKQTYQRTRSGVVATIRAIARLVADEHTVAQRAAAKAASPRRRLAEVRAMYLPTGESQRERDVVPKNTTDPLRAGSRAANREDADV